MKNIDSPAQIEGEQKNVSVLFANIPEFTVTSEKSDSREVKDIKDKLFKSFIVIVYKYGGTVNKFIDNCMLVLFGAQVMHEDDPERAIYAGLDMMNAMEQFNEEHGTEFSLSIGINYGTVTVRTDSLDSGRDYKPMGDTVDYAKCLMEIAKDEILVSESIYKSTSYLFEMDIRKPVSIKKKLEIISPYRVLGMKAKPDSKHSTSTFFSPLIGRDKEFKIMNNALNSVIKKKSMVISINGKAGVGKSYLIREFKKVITDKVNWLSGRCLSYGKDFPFWVFLEQIRSYIGLRAFDLESESRKKVGGKAERLFKERKDEYLPYLCVFLSIKILEHLQDKVKYLDPKSLRLQEFVSIQALFRDIAKDKPLILYFEDIHWIDIESLELLKFLIDGLKDVPIFFLFETRPEQEVGSYNIRESIQKIFKKRYTKISLKTLNANDSKTLIQSLLQTPGLPRNVLSLIFEKSEGNPFYIVEIVRSFIESGVLKRDNGSWKLTKDISSFKIPDSVKTVIRARIDNLSIEAQEVLGIASVIGKSFIYKVLLSLTNRDDLRKILDFLEERDFIQRKDGTSAALQLSSDTEYLFRHILIRDVVYKGLLKKKRKEIHKNVAKCMEDKFGKRIKNQYEMIAYHYYQAEIYKKSYEYYKKAGDEAKRRYRNNIAIECYAKAIEIHKKIYQENKKENLAELFEKRGDIREIKAEYDKATKDYEDAFKYYKNIEKKSLIKGKIATIYRVKGEPESAVSCYEEAINLVEHIPESPAFFEILSHYEFYLGSLEADYSGKERITKQILKKIERTKDLQIRGRLLNILGTIFRSNNNYDKAIKYFKESQSTYKKLNDNVNSGRAFYNIGIIYHTKGELDTALKYYKKYLSSLKKTDDKITLGIVSCNIGILYCDKGENDNALKYYERYLKISEKIGYKKGIGVVSNLVGNVYYSKGELDTALKYYNKYLVISEEISNKYGTGTASCNIGVVYHDKSEFDIALKYFKTYLRIAEEMRFKKDQGIALDNIGTTYYNKGEFDTALKYFKKNLTLSEKIGYKTGIGIACLNIGGVYLEIKKYTDAKVYLERSKEILTEIGNWFYLSKVLTLLSDLNHSQKNYIKALRFAEKALSLATEIRSEKRNTYALRVSEKTFSEERSKQALSYIKKFYPMEEHNMHFKNSRSLYEYAKTLKNSGKVRKKYVNDATKTYKKLAKKDGIIKTKKPGKKTKKSSKTYPSC